MAMLALLSAPFSVPRVAFRVFSGCDRKILLSGREQAEFPGG